MIGRTSLKFASFAKSKSIDRRSTSLFAWLVLVPPACSLGWCWFVLSRLVLVCSERKVLLAGV
jgi:hypothetical protein